MVDPKDFLNKASGINRWKGYYYYKAGNVISTEYISEDKVKAIVKGSYNNTYDVILDFEKPTKSECNCPHAIGRRIFCKHKIAAFYSLFPEFTKALEKMEKEYAKEEEEVQNRRSEIYKRIEEEVNNMSIEEIKRIAINSLYEAEIQNEDMSEYDYDHDNHYFW